MPALGAFPGRNGLLVGQPAVGSGLVLLDARGGGERRVCGSVVLCGHPIAPRWSPDGRDIVFADRASSRLGIVAADGTCLWCLLGARLSSVPGSRPAFTSGGSAVSFIRDSGPQRGLWQVGLGGSRGGGALKGAFTDAVWSAGGRLALVRAGSVWVA